MNVDFKIFKVKEGDCYGRTQELSKSGEFIMVGTDDVFAMVHPVEPDEERALTIMGSKLDEFAYGVLTDHLVSTDLFITLDIDKSYLTLDILESIQNLNELKLK